VGRGAGQSPVHGQSVQVWSRVARERWRGWMLVHESPSRVTAWWYSARIVSKRASRAAAAAARWVAAAAILVACLDY